MLDLEVDSVFPVGVGVSRQTPISSSRTRDTPPFSEKRKYGGKSTMDRHQLCLVNSVGKATQVVSFDVFGAGKVLEDEGCALQLHRPPHESLADWPNSLQVL